MMCVRRPAVIPPTLRPGGSGGKKASANEAARVADPKAALSFPDHWNLADVRGLLYAAQGRACGYCGRALPGNDRGDVDHFRPKNPAVDDPDHGGYWWLAYDIENYFLSCSTCNSAYKGNKFPLRPRSRRLSFQDRSRLHDEARLLLDPSRDPLDTWLRVEYQEPLCPVVPAKNLSRTAASQVRATLEFFRINHDVFLVKERKKFRDEVARELDAKRFQAVRDRAVRYRPYSLVARQMLAGQGQRLPTPAEELDALIGEILAYLDVALKILETPRGPDTSRDAERTANEMLWSLAALWRSPPAGSSRGFEDRLRREKVREFVKDMYDQFAP
jgi:hypothetical protein